MRTTRHFCESLPYFQPAARWWPNRAALEILLPHYTQLLLNFPRGGHESHWHLWQRDIEAVLPALRIVLPDGPLHLHRPRAKPIPHVLVLPPVHISATATYTALTLASQDRVSRVLDVHTACVAWKGADGRSQQITSFMNGEVWLIDANRPRQDLDRLVVEQPRRTTPIVLVPEATDTSGQNQTWRDELEAATNSKVRINTYTDQEHLLLAATRLWQGECDALLIPPGIYSAPVMVPLLILSEQLGHDAYDLDPTGLTWAPAEMHAQTELKFPLILIREAYVPRDRRGSRIGL